MKVYVVLCNNGGEWLEEYRQWIDSIHKTRDGAVNHIIEHKGRYEYIENRINELEALMYVDGRELTEEQTEELNKLYDERTDSYWNCSAYVEEYELTE